MLSTKVLFNFIFIVILRDKQYLGHISDKQTGSSTLNKTTRSHSRLCS